MNYDALAAVITDKTKAVIPVDIGGVIENYDRVFDTVEIRRDLFNLSDNEIQKALGRVAVVADAAHSFGAVYHGCKSGAAADFTRFSLVGVKDYTSKNKRKKCQYRLKISAICTNQDLPAA